LFPIICGIDPPAIGNRREERQRVDGRDPQIAVGGSPSADSDEPFGFEFSQGFAEVTPRDMGTAFEVGVGANQIAVFEPSMAAVFKDENVEDSPCGGAQLQPNAHDIDG
jgi:hypothetical protein